MRLALACLIAACLCAGQTDSTFRSDVREVIVPVTVTDGKGQFVPDLKATDFKIFEENKQQQIRFFTRERSQPLVVGFLLDLSTASTVHWETIQNAAADLIESILTGDARYSGYLVDYAQDAAVSVDTTTSSGPLVDRIRNLKPGGGAALYDAVYLACTSRKLVKGEPLEPRRLLIVIGDGHDNASKHSLPQVLEIAERNLVTVYGISTKVEGSRNGNDDNFQKLVIETGGRIVYPLGDLYHDTDGYTSRVDGARMNRAITDIVGEVTTQYILRYVSDNPKDKAYRKLKVVVDLENVKVRARKGYFASSF